MSDLSSNACLFACLLACLLASLLACLQLACFCEDGWTGLNGQPAVRGDTSGDMYCPNLVGEDKDLRTLALLACLLALKHYTHK